MGVSSRWGVTNAMGRDTNPDHRGCSVSERNRFLALLTRSASNGDTGAVSGVPVQTRNITASVKTCARFRACIAGGDAQGGRAPAVAEALWTSSARVQVLLLAELIMSCSSLGCCAREPCRGSAAGGQASASFLRSPVERQLWPMICAAKADPFVELPV